MALSLKCLINAVTEKVGTGTKMSGYPTNRELIARSSTMDHSRLANSSVRRPKPID